MSKRIFVFLPTDFAKVLQNVYPNQMFNNLQISNSLKIITFAIILSACSSTSENEVLSNEAPILLNTNWQGAAPSTLGLDFRLFPRDESKDFFTEYNSPEGYYSMHIRGGCNGASAGYLQNGWNLISTGVIPSTIMSCGQIRDNEDLGLADALAKVRTFKIAESGELILLDENKQALLHLYPMVPEPTTN